MNHFKLFSSKSILLGGIILGFIMLPAVSVNGQCVAKHYLKRHGGSTYQAAGFNPYTGRYVFSVYFTPLQNQLYRNVVPGCAGCATALNSEAPSGDFAAAAADASSMKDSNSNPVGSPDWARARIVLGMDPKPEPMFLTGESQ